MVDGEAVREAIMKDIERQLLNQAAIDAPWDLVTTFAEMPRWRPQDVNASADVIADRLGALGIPVTMHEPTVYLSIPLNASVESSGETWRAKPPSNAASFPEGIEAELVYLPANLTNLRSYSKNVQDLFGASVTSIEKAKALLGGKILITEGFGNPALTALAEEWGAVGLIAVNPGIDIHWGTCTTIWGTPDLDDLPRKPRIPVVAVNKPAGEALIRIAGEGGYARIRTELEEGWFPQKIPTVDIPGAVEPDKFILLHGHYDSWDVGVGDNATGDATLLELARVFWNNRDRLRRSVRVAWWPGHSTGRYAGSTWYADAFAIDLDENCVAQINCDSPGCRWATSYHQTTCMSEAEGHVRGVIEDIAGQTPIFKRPNQAGDYSFNNIGLSSYYMLSSTMPDALKAEKGYYAVSGCGGNIAWHTENDQLEIADQEVLLTDIKIYLLSALRHANAEILPVDWRATMCEFKATIARYQEAAGDLFDLSPAQGAVQALDDALSRLEGTPERINAIYQGLARILVPINYTREPRFRHDPAFTCPPLPIIAIATELKDHDPDMIGFAKTQLMRGQNRLVATLRAATRLVEGGAS